VRSALVAILRSVFLAGGLLLGVISVGCALAGLGGAFSNRLDTFTDFSPIWASCGILAIGIGLSVRSRIAAILGAVGLILAGALIVPEALYAAGGRQQPLAQPALTVVEFNLWAGNRQQARTADWILAQHADVLVLEEAFGGTEQIMTTLRQHYPYSTRCRRSPCSSVILSLRPPIATGDMQRLPGEAKHLSGSWATFRDAHGTYTVVGVHFGWPWPFGDHLAQRHILIRSVQRFPHDRLIVAGDFNSTPWSFDLRTIARSLGLTRYSRSLPSWPAQPGTAGPIALPFPIMPIDHVFAGPAWTQVRVRRGPLLGSDHYPLVIQLADSPG